MLCQISHYAGCLYHVTCSLHILIERRSSRQYHSHIPHSTHHTPTLHTSLTSSYTHIPHTSPHTPYSTPTYSTHQHTQSTHSTHHTSTYSTHHTSTYSTHHTPTHHTSHPHTPCTHHTPTLPTSFRQRQQMELR